jgi:5-formyltetrahydrofolate cyclo-ligase
MEFCHVQSLKKDLAKGKFGIMEPRGDLPAYTGDFTVFLVPGTKFNLTGERCGHGKGYYDRFLAKYPDTYKAGIATPKQISVEPLTQKPTDIKMNQIIICREKP